MSLVRSVRSCWIAGVACCAACATSPNPAATRSDASLWPPADSALVSADDPPSSSALLARAAPEIPGGFGGLYIEPSPESRSDRVVPGRLMIQLVEPGRRAEAIAVLRQRVDIEHVGPVLGWDEAGVVRARWTYAQLDAWRRYIIRHVPWAEGGGGSVGVDERRNRVRLGVWSAAARDAVLGHLARHRVPTDLVVVEVESPVCRAPVSAAIVVWARDAETNASVTTDAWLILRSRAYVDSSRGMADSPLAAGWEQTGTFDVTVRKAGYHDWTRRAVRVEPLPFCGPKAPKQVELTAAMTRR